MQVYHVCKSNTDFQDGLVVKNPPAMQETQQTWVQFLGLKDPLEEEIATDSSILDWNIPWTEGVWWATIHRVVKSQTWLSDWAHKSNKSGNDS